MRLSICWIVPLLALLTMTGCGGYGDVVQTTESVEIGDAVIADIGIEMAVGELRIAGQSAELMVGSFEYNTELIPQITYEVEEAGHGILFIKQQSAGRFSYGNTSNSWDILLNPVTPRFLSVQLDSASGEIQLGSLQLEGMSLDTETGDAELVINGEQLALTSVGITTASGDINAKLDGSYKILDRIDMTSITGDLMLDISGEWTLSPVIEIETTSGDVALTVPDNIGVKVRATTNSGDVEAGGLIVDDGSYVNDNIGKTAVTIEVTVTTTSGDLSILQE